MSDTLVLNSAWEPINTITWEEAFTILLNQSGSKFKNKIKAHVVEYYENRIVHSATNEWKVPSVIRLIGTFTRNRKSIRFSRDSIYIRDGGKCQYCNKHVLRSEFTLDHVIPKARGGRTTWENTVVACVDCNQRKGDSLVGERGFKLLKKPTRPDKLSTHYIVGWQRNMPDSWRSYMRDNLYWHGELINDNVG